MTYRALALSALLCGAAVADLGVVDTVGGTIYDWQFNGPTYRWVASAGPYGFYVAWMYSSDTVGGVNPDRNIRTNFYNYSTHGWNWSNPDFMVSGVNAFTERSGFGSLDVNHTSWVAVVSCHQGSAPIHPVVARDVSPGAGIYEYSNGSPVLDGYLWPPVAVGRNLTLHLVCADDATRDNLWYSRAVRWRNWQEPMSVTPAPPTFPAHTIAASKVSQRVCIAWPKVDVFPYTAYYRISTDDGATWEPETELPFPPAFGPDTTCSYFITSPFPFYDRDDQLHIVVDVLPIVNDTVWNSPIEIWHWCPDNNPAWGRVHRAGADQRNQPPGVRSLAADRPTIGEDSRGNLFVGWEQWDTMNLEPRTSLLRADVWIAGSSDNGETWVPGCRLTGPDSASRQFPCVIDWAVPGTPNCDTVVVAFLEDLCSGLRAGSSPVGPWTDNPIVVYKIPVDSILPSLPGVGGPLAAEARMLDLVVPSPARDMAVIRYSLPVAGDVTLVVFDAAGRLVAEPVKGHRAAGTHLAAWDAPEPGVYFLSLVVAGQEVLEKVVVTR